MANYSTPTGETIPENMAFLQSIQALLEQGASMAKPFEIGGIPCLTLGKPGSSTGFQVQDFERLLLWPQRKRASVTVKDAQSFRTYINRYGNQNALAIYDATETGATFTAILDYHFPKDGSANWGEHRVVYPVTATPEWTRWTGHNKKAMSQADFAAFLEENGVDINPNGREGQPSQADMEMIAREIEATSSGDFGSVTRLASGSVQLRWTETVTASAKTDSGTIEIPERFIIGIAPFVGFDGFEIRCRLKYRLNAGKLSLWYEMERTHKVVEEAVKLVLEQILADTGLVPLRGEVRSMGRALQQG